MRFRTRFAPSPTGPLHLGHAYSAILAHDMARAAGGDFLLRIEDIDQSRARPEWETAIFDDLGWLGLTWEEPVVRQSERMDRYQSALQRLWDAGLIYPCTCNRRDILAAVSAPQEGAPLGPDGIIYPGTCRDKHDGTGPLPKDLALRLNMERAAQAIFVEDVQAKVTIAGTSASTNPTFLETGSGPNGETGTIELLAETLVSTVGDVVLARRDMGTSYHLSVVVDDADQEISHVVRGQDLFEATQIHVVLQKLLGLATPTYHHHDLIRDETGTRLAKRHDSKAIRLFRDTGLAPSDIRTLVGL